MKKKGFTLVELLAVIVILAIIALITIPIVIKTINNSQEESEKQSIIGYARAVENDIANYMLDPTHKYDNYEIPDNLDYKGNKVTCGDLDLSTRKLKLMCCKVEGGKTGYDYDNGKVEKSTDNKCNSDSGNDNSSNQVTYTAYSIGDEIIVAGEQYYVIADSDSSKDYVTALKANPLTVDEINTYGGVGTENNHVNQYAGYSQGVAYNWNDVNYTGGMQYYSSSTCGEVNGSDIIDGCTTDYTSSEIRYVIDTWAQAKFTNGELKTVDRYEARLITREEYLSIPSTESWRYAPNHTYFYWTMSQYENSTYLLWYVSNDSYSYSTSVGNTYALRPVINVYKNKI